MTTVLLLLHLVIAAALVGVVLLQRSEGGGLGLGGGGGGGGGGGFMTGRGTANFLTRLTVGLAAAFFVTSISLTLLARHTNQRVSPLDRPASGGVLDSLEKGKQRLPSSGSAPATPSAPAAPAVPKSQ